ncbi:putative NBD/HSP70 family sugar kinase [Rhizobium skierniewicense]|uniref:Putative NBD/HSP70 family sugar kinase n=2 Tax=Rhizobium skierniewicense TaxID=984260 RepID=A0A7W6C427_9HYPH|nr:putative NBD/HSP70 family sugar kinase [Rhizobium skierniewicense]
MSMPRAVRHINEIRVLEVVFRAGKVSRANIARELGLTRSTASSLVAGLADEGLLLEDTSGEDKGAGTGRPGTFLRLNPKHGLFLGADIGVGHITIIALDFAGSIIANRNFQFETDRKDFEKLTSQLARCVSKVVRSIGPGYILRGLSVIVPGVIDRSGTVLRAPFLGWRRVPLLERMSALLPEMPVVVAENDANAFALADGYRSQIDQNDTSIYILLDAGVGGAVVTSGQLLRGHDGYAGEFGHIILGEQGFVELATPSGSFESFVGHDAVLARHRHYGGTCKTVDALMKAAQNAEPAALKTIKDWSFYLGRGLALISSIFNPSRIVLGGRVAALYHLCVEHTQLNIRGNLLDDHPLPIVNLSRTGLEGPALGGASMLHRQMFSVDKNLVFRIDLQT